MRIRLQLLAFMILSILKIETTKINSVSDQRTSTIFCCTFVTFCHIQSMINQTLQTLIHHNNAHVSINILLNIYFFYNKKQNISVICTSPDVRKIIKLTPCIQWLYCLAWDILLLLRKCKKINNKVNKKLIKNKTHYLYKLNQIST